MTERELNEVRELTRRLDDTERRLLTSRAAVEKMTPMLDGMPHASKPTSRLDFLIIQILDLESEREKLRDLISCAAEKLTQRLQKILLSTKEHAVIILRYVACMSFRDIQLKLQISDTRMYFLHQIALKKILSDR